MLALDPTPLNEKISQLVSLVDSAFPEDIPDDIRIRLSDLSDNIIFGELTSALTTNRPVRIVLRVDFDCGFDDVAAALRAGNRKF